MIPLWAQWLAAGSLVWVGIVQVQVAILVRSKLQQRRHLKAMLAARDQFEKQLADAIKSRVPEKEMN